MFGRSNGADDGQNAPSTSSILGDMFGLGGLMKVITDPALVQHAHAMMQATIDGAHASRRIEAKLDRLLGALGHEINDINSRFPAQLAGPAPALLEQGRADGARGHPATTGAAHDGGPGAADGVATIERRLGHGEPDDGVAGGRQ